MKIFLVVFLSIEVVSFFYGICACYWVKIQKEHYPHIIYIYKKIWHILWSSLWIPITWVSFLICLLGIIASDGIQSGSKIWKETYLPSLTLKK